MTATTTILHHESNVCHGSIHTAPGSSNFGACFRIHTRLPHHATEKPHKIKRGCRQTTNGRCDSEDELRGRGEWTQTMIDVVWARCRFLLCYYNETRTANEAWRTDPNDAYRRLGLPGFFFSGFLFFSSNHCFILVLTMLSCRNVHTRTVKLYHTTYKLN